MTYHDAPEGTKGRLRLLDAFCGAGGAAMGYHRAGFDVVGVDHKPQPRFPFEFHRGDALEFIREHGHEFDAIHASPPCQAYSSLKAWNPHKEGTHPDLIEPTRTALQNVGRPYVIENVVGSPLKTTLRLCGTSFGLRVMRHRLFESDIYLFGRHCQHGDHERLMAVYGDHPENARVGIGSRIWRAPTLEAGQAAMGIDWMTWRELTQAIPPAYTEFIGRQLMTALEGTEAA